MVGPIYRCPAVLASPSGAERPPALGERGQTVAGDRRDIRERQNQLNRQSGHGIKYLKVDAETWQSPTCKQQVEDIALGAVGRVVLDEANTLLCLSRWKRGFAALAGVPAPVEREIPTARLPGRGCLVRGPNIAPE